MVNSAEFTKRLEEILKFYGLSATAFAESIDFNRSTISHLLSGRNKPSLEFVMKVVKQFPEVELYWLLNGKGSFPPTEGFSSNLFEQQNSKSEKISEKVKNEKISDTSNSQINPPKEFQNQNNSNTQSIERIIIFYKDGSFKEYLP